MTLPSTTVESRSAASALSCAASGAMSNSSGGRELLPAWAHPTPGGAGIGNALVEIAELVTLALRALLEGLAVALCGNRVVECFLRRGALGDCLGEPGAQKGGVGHFRSPLSTG